MMFTIPLLLAVPLLAIGFTARSRSLEKSYIATLTTATAHLAATVYLLLTQRNPFAANTWFGIDPLGSFFLLILSHTFLAVALYSPGFLQRMQKPEYNASRRLYYPALNSYLLANTLVIITQHFSLLWVVLELTTFSLAPLIYFYRSKESLEAVWKYLFLVSLGLVFLLIGILAFGLAAKGAGEHASLLLADLVRDAAQLDPLWVKVGFVFALVGISAKIGLAPMHPADIDATSNAPGPVAALMAGSLRSTAIAGIAPVLRSRLQYKRARVFAALVDDRGCLLALGGSRLHLAEPRLQAVARLFERGASWHHHAVNRRGRCRDARGAAAHAV